MQDRDAGLSQAARRLVLLLILCLTLTLSGCGGTESLPGTSQGDSSSGTAVTETEETSYQGDITLSNIPAYSGSPSVDINGGQADFADSELTLQEQETYPELDHLGRCGTCQALVGPETMPTAERTSIGEVKPSGWHLIKYDFIDGKYLYNRCHLIGYQLTGENANPRNLITGTRYLNVTGMLPYENEVADYVSSTGNHVLYRSSPVFQGDNLVASGVHMMAESVEDEGAAVNFNVYCYNVQPGVTIDYATGDSQAEEGTGEVQETETQGSYVINVNTGRFHLPDCSSVDQMKQENRVDYTGSRQKLIDAGYTPCGLCNP